MGRAGVCVCVYVLCLYNLCVILCALIHRRCCTMRIHVDTNKREGCPRLHVSPGHISTSSKRIICRPPMLQYLYVFMRMPHTYMIIYYSHIIIHHHKSCYHYLSFIINQYIYIHMFLCTSSYLIVSAYIP